MFLVDEGRTADNFQAVADHITGLLERHGADVDTMEKWDSRRLAYPVNGKKRGTYVLATFSADPAMIAPLTEDCRLSNIILRALMLRAEHVGVSVQEAEVAKAKAKTARLRAEAGPEAEGEEPAAEGEPEKPAEAGAEAEADAEPASDILGDVSELESPDEPDPKPEPDAEPEKKPEPDAEPEKNEE